MRFTIVDRLYGAMFLQLVLVVLSLIWLRGPLVWQVPSTLLLGAFAAFCAAGYCDEVLRRNRSKRNPVPQWMRDLPSRN